MKILNGSDLASFIKERQAKQVRSVSNALNRAPRLAIILTIDDPVINTYVRLKKQYGLDIGIAVEAYSVTAEKAVEKIKELNEDDTVDGIIVQLPLSDVSLQDSVLNSVAAGKDVDGLSDKSIFDPATPMAIEWLLNGYNIELKGKNIALVGKGKLVGAPLKRLLSDSGYAVSSYDKNDTEILGVKLLEADIVVSATGSPGLIKSEMIKHGAVAIDAGVAVESGQKIGDFSEDLYLRDDIKITPRRGGVGPLTVSALFENVIRSTQLK